MNCFTENKAGTSISRMRFLMNTFCSIQAEGEDSVLVEAAIKEAFSEITRLENIFSRHLKDSEISKVNREASDSDVLVSNEVFQLIARALRFSRETQGAFDISLGTALDFWRSYEGKNTLPTNQQIKELKSKVGYQDIHLDFGKQTVRFKKQGIQMDLGALAKGHALDRAVSILKNRGVERAQVNLGGNIYVLDIQPREIAIRNPLVDDEIITTVSLMNTLISTSANYERSFSIAGKKFGHLIDPFTALPAVSDILSASIISADATLADALSTAVFILGFEKAKAILEYFKEVEAIIICRPKFTNRLKIFQLKGGL